MKFYVPKIVEILGYEKVLKFNTPLMGLGLMSFAFLPTLGASGLIALLAFNGALHSLHYSVINAYTFIGVSPEFKSSASSLYATAQQISMGLGVTIGSLALYLREYSEFNLEIGDFSRAFVALGMGLIASSVSFQKKMASTQI